MRATGLSLLFAALTLTACPQPPDGTTAGGNPAVVPGGPGAGGPGAGGPGPAAGGPAAEGGPAVVPATGEGATFEPGVLPTGFANLPEGTETVTLTVKLVGSDTARVDLTRMTEQDGREVPEVVHAVQVTGSAFTLDLPANYESPLYLLAFVNEGGDGPKEGGLVGFDKTPLKVGTDDISVTITLSNDTDIMNDVPWFDADAPPVEQPVAPIGVPSGPSAPAGGVAPAAPVDAAPADAAEPPAPQ